MVHLQDAVIGYFKFPFLLIVIRGDGGEPLRGPLGPVHLQSVALYHGGRRRQDVLSVLKLCPFFDRLLRGRVAVQARGRRVPRPDRLQLVVILEIELEVSQELNGLPAMLGRGLVQAHRVDEGFERHGGVQRAGVWLRVGRGGAVCEDEVLLEEEEGDVLFVDGDPLPPVPVQVVVLHQHLNVSLRVLGVAGAPDHPAPPVPMGHPAQLQL